MKKIKFLAIGLMLLIIFSALTSCSKIKYNAKLFDDAIEWINKDFINDNPVGYSENNSYPSNRTFIVKNQEDYSQIFNGSVNELVVDFTNQMLAIYTFSSIYHRDSSLVNLNTEENILKITYKMEEKPGVGDASQPYQRWFVVLLDKLNVKSVIFVEK